MTTRYRNLALGVAIAVALTTIAVVPTIAGVSTWKWALAVLGGVFFLLAERRSHV